MAKYKKVGQTDHYQKVKENSGCGTFIGFVVLAFIVMLIIGSCSN